MSRVTGLKTNPVSLSVGDDPYLYIVRLYTQFLQGLFNFFEPGDYRWSADRELTEIMILGSAPVDSQVVGKKPALVVTLGPTQDNGLGIGNLLDIDMRTGDETRTDLISGYLVVYCLAEIDIQATTLGHRVKHGTRSMQRILEQRGGFHSIGRPGMQMNSPSPPGALIQGDPLALSMVQVNIPFTFQWTWTRTVNRQAPQEMSIEMITGQSEAKDFPYQPPLKLERVELSVQTASSIVRRIRGRYAARPDTVQVSEGQELLRTEIHTKREE